MKNKILSIVLLFSSMMANAQKEDSLETRFLLDFAVPDLPAFKALGTEPSDLLRPSELKDFAAAFSPFYSGGKGIIPKNFAMEVAPWKLASQNWHLDQYKGFRKMLYNTGFSLGTVQDSGSNASKLSAGFRITIHPGHNDIISALAHNKSYVSMEQSLLDLITLIRNVTGKPAAEKAVLLQRYNTINAGTALPDAGALDDDILLQFVIANPEQFKEDEYRELVEARNKVIYNTRISSADSFQSITQLTRVYYRDVVLYYKDSVAKYYSDRVWNATRIDFAGAYVAASPDSLLRKTQFSSFQLWATIALNVHKGGQLLFGSNIALPRTEQADSVATRMDIAFNARYYLGNDKVRGFLETQYKYKNFNADPEKTLLFNLGTEFCIARRFWVVASTGINNYLGKEDALSQLVASVNLRYGLNRF